MKRVAVFGASGLVGTALCERFLDRGIQFVPIIHSSGNAWRLARRGIELRTVNLLSAGEVHAAVAGCTHVVNCTRGGSEVMLTGLKHLLDAAFRAGAAGFVHLSSVLIYGDPPAAEASSEAAQPPRQAKETYGWVKLEQDRLVQKAARRGLASAILCPPNVGGPCSYFLLRVLEVMRAGRFALIGSEASFCNLVDVGNLAYAIELALDHCSADARRLFVTDDEETSWAAVAEELLELVDGMGPPESVSRDEAIAVCRRGAPDSATLSRSLRHLFSDDMRAVLRRDPLWEKADKTLRNAVARLGTNVEERISRALRSPRQGKGASTPERYDVRLLAQQLRGVRHSCARAKAELGYRPVYSFRESMLAFRTWYRAEHRMDTEFWSLLRQLY